MTPGQLATIGVIVSIFGGLMGVYYLARSSAREAAKQRADAIKDAVATAVKPVQDALDLANRVIERREQTIRDRDARIDSLEDELRRGRTGGD